jgi:FkbM family methyltransferase
MGNCGGMIMVTFPIFQFFRWLLVLVTGRGYDRSDWINNLHHKLSFRLHKLLPVFGITGIQRVPAPGMEGKVLFVRAEDGGVAHQLIMYKEYEPYQSSLVQKYIKPGMTVYNIGANIGYYTLLASKCVGPEGKVYAFEPAPENFELLQKNVTENKLGNVEIFPLAIGANPGSATLSLSSTNSGDHRLQNITNRDHIVVSVISIDSFIEEGHSAPDAIIMDVQGAEFDVLQGSSKAINGSNPFILFTEFWPKGLNDRNPDGARNLLETIVRAGVSMNIIDEKRRLLAPTPTESLLKNVTGDAEVNLLCISCL